MPANSRRHKSIPGSRRQEAMVRTAHPTGWAQGPG